MPTARDVLNRLRWAEGGLAGVEIWYVHRGAPNDTRIVEGAAVRDIGRSFLDLAGPRGGASIPFHRVFRITRGSEVLYERSPQDPEPEGDVGEL